MITVPLTNAQAAELRAALLPVAKNLVSRLRGRRPDPEDIVQQILLEMLPRMHEIDQPIAYGRVAVGRRIIDHILLHDNRAAQWDEDQDRRSAPAGGGAFEPRLRKVLAALPKEKRRFLILVVIDEESVKTAAKKAGWPKKSPFHHLERLLAWLRQQLEDPR